MCLVQWIGDKVSFIAALWKYILSVCLENKVFAQHPTPGKAVHSIVYHLSGQKKSSEIVLLNNWSLAHVLSRLALRMIRIADLAKEGDMSLD